jgi:7-cyano-7-deazaguanine synthase
LVTRYMASLYRRVAMPRASQPSCVLFSGGLDSAVLLALELQSPGPVHPVHVRAGLAWEDAERRAIDRLLAAQVFAKAAPLSTVAVDMRDVYPPTHWAVIGRPPAYDTPDEDVYLEGRNIVLLSKTAVPARASKPPASRSVRLRTIRFPTRRLSSSPPWRAPSPSGLRARSRWTRPSLHVTSPM